MTTSISAIADQGALQLLVWSWQALVLLACVWAFLKFFRVQTPGLRQQIWLIGLLAVLSMPFWGILLPRSKQLRENARTTTGTNTWMGSALSYTADLPRLVIVAGSCAHRKR